MSHKLQNPGHRSELKKTGTAAAEPDSASARRCSPGQTEYKHGCSSVGENKGAGYTDEIAFLQEASHGQLVLCRPSPLKYTETQAHDTAPQEGLSTPLLSA